MKLLMLTRLPPFAHSDDTASMLGVLVTHGYTKEAREVQRKFTELLATVREHLPSIWAPPPPPPPTSGLVSQGTTGPGATVNSIIAAMATPGAQPATTGRNGREWDGN